MSGLGAHVAGEPAYLIAALLRAVNVEERLRVVPPASRAATLETLDDIRGAARVWDENRKAGRHVLEPAGMADNEPLGAFLTTSQAAEALGVTERRVRQLADAGTLAGRKLGRRWQLETDSVQARCLADDISEGTDK